MVLIGDVSEEGLEALNIQQTYLTDADSWRQEKQHCKNFEVRERFKKKIEKKLTNVSFMYVCVAGNGFFRFSPNNSLIDNSLSE